MSFHLYFVYLKFHLFNFQSDNTGTVATKDRLKEENGTSLTNGKSPTEPSSNEEASAVPINENLFTEEDLEDLDEELKDLDLDE